MDFPHGKVIKEELFITPSAAVRASSALECFIVTL